ncbi:hypothetical protein P7K49_009822, partial [Saguinus oedipus]
NLLRFQPPPESHFQALIAKEINAPTQPCRKPVRSCDSAAPAAACAPSGPISTLHPAAIASCPRRSVGGAFVLRRAGGLTRRRQQWA